MKDPSESDDDRQDTVRDTDIAIVGIACRLPGAPDKDAFWDLLRNGRHGIRRITEDELRAEGLSDEQIADPSRVPYWGTVDGFQYFDEAFFGFSRREAQLIDPQQRLFLECVWHALEDAGEPPGRPGNRIGVYAGVGRVNYAFKRVQQMALDSMNAQFSLDKDYVASRVSYKLDLRGPSLNVQTACSTSLVACHLGVQALLTGECDVAVVGGSSLHADVPTGYSGVEGLLSPSGRLRAFDAGAHGMVPGEGVAAVVLKRASDALAAGDRIYALVRASAINNDGIEKVSYAAPGVDGQANVIAEALSLANVDAESIQFVEAHGTGTAMGDQIEVAALTKAFRAQTDAQQFCALGSVKTNIGHTDATAGVAGLIKLALCLQHETMVPSLDFERPNPRLELESSPFFVNTETKAWPRGREPRRGGVSAFGIGGTNAHVIVEEPPARATSGAGRKYQVVEFSARSEQSLAEMSESFAAFLENRPDISLADLAYTLRVGRKTLPYRRAVVAATAGDAARSLREGDPARTFTRTDAKTRRDICFMFPGAGAHQVGMAAGLYESEPVFRREVDHCLARLRAVGGGIDARAVLYPTHDIDAQRARIQEPTYMLGTLFAIEYALAKLWISWGVQPAAVMGHSAGEYVAACIAGVMSLDDALRLNILRGQLSQRVRAAGMLSVALAASELEPLAKQFDVDIALVNAPAACVVAGDLAAIERLSTELSRRQIDVRRIAASGASHCRLVEPLLAEFRAAFASVALHAPTMPFVSAVTAKLMTHEVAKPDYWVEHFRSTVRFAEAAEVALADASRVMLEVGPGTALTSFVRQVAAARSLADRIVVASMRKPSDPESDEEIIARAVARLSVSGVTVDPKGFHANEQRRKCDTPSYPFARRRHWLPVDPWCRPDAQMQDMALLPGNEPSDALVELPPRPDAVAPETDTEREMAAIWSRVLGVNVIDVNADYFELGGTSLQGLGLKRMIDTTFGLEIPASGLVQHPTVRRMAGWIDALRSRDATKVEDPSADAVVEIQRGSEPALYLVHGGGGEVFDFRTARGVIPNRAIRAIRDFVTPETGGGPATLEEQAAAYVEQIKRHQKRGPYLVGGHSFGGLVALEIAQQLTRAGDAVALVVLLDAIDIRGIATRHGDDYLDGMIRSTFGSERQFSNAEIEELLTNQTAFDQLGLGVDFSLVRRLVRATQSNVRRGRHYELRAYPGHIAFIRARERQRINVERPEEPFLDLAAGGASFAIVDGDHWSMLRGPNANATWSRVSGLIDRAMRR